MPPSFTTSSKFYVVETHNLEKMNPSLVLSYFFSVQNSKRERWKEEDDFWLLTAAVFIEKSDLIWEKNRFQVFCFILCEISHSLTNLFFNKFVLEIQIHNVRPMIVGGISNFKNNLIIVIVCGSICMQMSLWILIVIDDLDAF